MPSQVGCPDEGTLRAYLDGQLPAAAQAEIAHHVNDCAACAHAAGDLAALAHTVAMALDRVVVPTPATAAAYQRFVNEQRPLNASRRGGAILSYASRILSWRVQMLSQNRRVRWQPALFGAVLAVLLLGVVAIAPLRAAASQFLDVFRVHKITVIQVDPAQLDKIQGFQGQLFSNMHLPKDQAVPVTNAAQASQEAGFRVLGPGYLPAGLNQPSTFMVEKGGHAQGTVDLEAARALLQMASISSEGVIPSGRESIDISAELKPVVTQHYAAGGKELTIVQGMSPDVTVPPDVNLAKVGEAGLQLMGMSPAAARQLAGKIDWTSTLVLPVPKNVASVQEVSVAGTTGYLVTEVARPAIPAPAAKSGQPESSRQALTGGHMSSLVWQQGNLLYMVEGNVDQQTLQQVAAGLK